MAENFRLIELNDASRRALGYQLLVFILLGTAKATASSSELSLKVSDVPCVDLKLREILPEPEVNSKAVVIIVHGIQESGYRYLDLAHFFVAHNFSVWIPDLRGHGSSGGE